MTTLNKFIKDFDIANPSWKNLPNGFPSCDLEGLNSPEIAKWNSMKTIWELSRPEKPISRSRVWQDPNGYQYLGVWQNAALLRLLIRKFTSTLPLSTTLNNPSSKPLEYRLKAQMDDAARSVKRNIEEGWKRATTSDYLQFLSYSQASLEEVKGDIVDCKTDGFLISVPGSNLKDKGFDLRVAKGPQKGKVWGEPTDPNHPYSKPLKTLDPKTLTYELFIELINKTDYLLQKLVESLEKKLDGERKGYMVDQARISG
jgi:four helix bundle protein